MESALLGLVLDATLLIAAERRGSPPARIVETVQKSVGEIPIVICALTIAEVGHGIYRATTTDIRNQRRVSR